jgi:heme/copper-type cytochrome/quinol oxidase subunit 2
MATAIHGNVEVIRTLLQQPHIEVNTKLNVSSALETKTESGEVERQSLFVESPDEETTSNLTHEQLPTMFYDLLKHYFVFYASIMSINIVSILAAIYLNRTLKTLVSPSGQDHTNVIGASAVLYLVAYCSTVLGARRCRTNKAVWVLGTVAGHIMGFSTKQLYVALVRENIDDEEQISLGDVCLNLLVFVVFIFLLEYITKRCYERARRARRAQEGGRTSNKLLALRRQLNVVKEATDDAYSIVLGFGMYAACYGTATYNSTTRQLGDLFTEEEACFHEKEESSNITLLSPSPRSIPSSSTDQYEYSFLICFLIMLLLLPLFTYYLKKYSKLKLQQHYAATTNRASNGNTYNSRCASFTKHMGVSFAFALGFSLNHILSGPLVYFASDDHITPGLMLLLIWLFALVSFLVATCMQSCAETNQTLSEQHKVSVGKCGKYMVAVIIPVFSIMWVVYVGLAFESFFECAQEQLIHTMKWKKNIAQSVFLCTSLGLLLVAYKCCGSKFIQHCEHELLESIQEKKLHRTCTNVADESIQTHLIHQDPSLSSTTTPV